MGEARGEKTDLGVVLRTAMHQLSYGFHHGDHHLSTHSSVSTSPPAAHSALYTLPEQQLPADKGANQTRLNKRRLLATQHRITSCVIGSSLCLAAGMQHNT